MPILTRPWIVLLALATAAPAAPAPEGVSVRDHGARGDGLTRDTAAIQRAIDAAASEGGGTVDFPAGRYRSGTLHLRSNITLRLSAGATLVASPDGDDFDPRESLDFRSADDDETTYFHDGLVVGESVQNVAITGEGTIDGNRPKRGGPKPISLKRCRQITLRGITLRDAPNYAISLLGCEQANIDGVSILNGYSDGIDPDNSRFVRISNCVIDSADDAIVLKASTALGRRAATENVTVVNCILSTSRNSFKLGTESHGDFRNIAVSNCVFVPRERGGPPMAGISLGSVDGGSIDGVVVSNIVMRGVRCPVFLRLGNRGRGQATPTPGSLANVTISRIVASDAAIACAVAGLPEHPVRQVSLDDVRVTQQAGGEGRTGIDLPENPSGYPQPTMFGPLPAWAFYGRHAAGLTLRGLQVTWPPGERRPAVVLDDVADLLMDGCLVRGPAGGALEPGGGPVLWWNQVRGGRAAGCPAPAGAAPFLRVTGAASRDLRLLACDLSAATRGFDLGPGVAPTSLLQTGNISPAPNP